MTVFDNASRLEVARQGIARLLVDMEPIRSALNQGLPALGQEKEIEEARQALVRLDSTLAEMKEAMESR